MLTPIGVLFGTRPEYLKCKPLFQAFDTYQIPYRILHVKQHKDLEVEESIKNNYKCIDIDSPLPILRLNELASNLPKFLEPAMSDCKSILVQGDTATAFFGCLTAFHLRLPIFHLEAGLRTYDLENPFPEEAYRSMISRLATYHLCPDSGAVKNLQKENIVSNIFLVGNTILDLVKSYSFTPQIGNRVLITVHRRENWNMMKEIAESIRALAMKHTHLYFDWILHPNPSLSNVVYQYFQGHAPVPNLCLLRPLCHKELAQKIFDCYCVITDSGGIQEEASFAGKFIFVLRKATERTAIPSNYIELVETPSTLLSSFQQFQPILMEACTAYGRGDTSCQIADLLRNLSAKKGESPE